MDYSVTRDDHHISVALKGRFTFEDHRKFKTIMDMVEESGTQAISFDLQELAYVDSAAIGMLLLLKDMTDSRSIGVTLANANNQVKTILEISSLDQVFTIQ